MTLRAININSRTWTGLIWTLKRVATLARAGSSHIWSWSCYLLIFYSNTILNFLPERANCRSSFWMRWWLPICGPRLWLEKGCSPTVYFRSHDFTSFHPFLLFVRNFETVLITTNLYCLCIWACITDTSGSILSYGHRWISYWWVFNRAIFREFLTNMRTHQEKSMTISQLSCKLDLNELCIIVWPHPSSMNRQWEEEWKETRSSISPTFRRGIYGKRKGETRNQSCGGLKGLTDGSLIETDAARRLEDIGSKHGSVPFNWSFWWQWGQSRS